MAPPSESDLPPRQPSTASTHLPSTIVSPPVSPAPIMTFPFPLSFVDADTDSAEAITPHFSRASDASSIRPPTLSHHSPSSASRNDNHSPSLRAFAQLPQYQFDYDYRGHTLRAPVMRTVTSPCVHTHADRTFHHYDASHVDDFDSYVFPEREDSTASPCPSCEDDDEDVFEDSRNIRPSQHHHIRPMRHRKQSHADSTLTEQFDTFGQNDVTRSISSDARMAAISMSSAPQATDHPLSRSSRARPRARSSGHAVVGSDETRRRQRGLSTLDNANDSTPAGENVDGDAIDWSLIRDAPLTFADGTPLLAERLYTGYCDLSVLLFLPRESVETCALVYAKVAHLLQQASTRLVFITAWSHEQASKFLNRFERIAPFPGTLVCDPSASLFTAFGLTRSPLRALFATNGISAATRQGVRNALSAVTYRAANRDIGSTAVPSKRLKAGAAVLKCLRGYDKIPDVVYVAAESVGTGVGCYLDVVAVTGVNDAFVPDIDVPQLLSRFNCMRATSLKARYADMRETGRVRSHHGSERAPPQQRTAPTGSPPPEEKRSSRKGDRRNALKA